jgi:peptidyl-prolyl cis-trans isomerase C
LPKKRTFKKGLFFLIVTFFLLPLVFEHSSGGEKTAEPEPAKEERSTPPPETPKEAQAPEQKVVMEDPFPAARVNGATISRTDLDKSMDSFIQQRGMDTGMITDPGRYRQAQMEVLDGLITRELLWQEAKKKNFVANEEDVKQAIGSVKGKFPSEDKFTLRLKQSGYTLEDYTEFLRRQLSVRELIQKDISRGISVSDEEVHVYYESNPEQFMAPEQVRARHILVKVEPGADEAIRGEAKAKIDSLLVQAKGGADFAELARKHSEGPSGPKGGDLGFFSRSQMVKPFEEAAFALKAGEISGVVQTVYGYHIIKVEERKEPQTIAEREVKEQVREFLHAGKVQEAVQERVNTLREMGKVEILLPR